MRIKKGHIFVGIQFLLLFLIFITGPNLPSKSYLLILFLVGVLVGIIAVVNMRVSKLRVTPEVAEGSVLVISGIYKYIRHPMYLGLILISIALILEYFTLMRLGLLIALIVNQYFKLDYEEKILAKHFAEYKKYKKTSKKLIPYIY